jgi:hypothetical protein
MRQGMAICKIVDGYDIEIGILVSYAEKNSAYATEAIYSYFDF